MPASLRPLTPEELSEFIDGDVERYVEERVRAGDRPEVARRIALEQSKALFPDGTPAAGQLLFQVLNNDGSACVRPQGPAERQRKKAPSGHLESQLPVSFRLGAHQLLLQFPGLRLPRCPGIGNLVPIWE